ncbi:DUF4037 domain-containing protein [Flavihumibacter solisilvae]|uniref:DUF4037 domain-containing protein n=1 Tax=Flavihumibacter solisilvae TaxID=1349421 RepID=UPI003B8308BB
MQGSFVDTHHKFSRTQQSLFQIPEPVWLSPLSSALPASSQLLQFQHQRSGQKSLA